MQKNNTQKLTLRKMLDILQNSGKVYDLDLKPLEDYFSEEFGEDYLCTNCEKNKNEDLGVCKGCEFLG